MGRRIGRGNAINPLVWPAICVLTLLFLTTYGSAVSNAANQATVSPDQNENNKRTESFDVSTVDPVPDIISVNYPSSVYLGESAIITIQGKNQGGQSPEVYLSVSFPSNPGNVSISSTDATHSRIYRPGDGVTGCYGTCSVEAQYPLVEMWEAPWGSGLQRSLSVEVTPESAGTFEFYVKMVAADNDSSTWFADPASSSYTDQQSEYVYRYIVNVIPTHVVITGISASPTTAYPGDTVNITVETRNDGAAGSVDVGATVFDANDALCNLLWQNNYYSVGETRTFTFQYVVPSNAPAGWYDIAASSFDDCSGNVSGQCIPDGYCPIEGRQDTRRDNSEFQVVTRPHVVITNISASPTTAHPGDTLNITVETRNDGAAGSVDVGATVFDANDALCNLLWQNNYYSVGETHTFTFQYVVPSNAPAGWYDIAASSFDDCSGNVSGQCIPDGYCPIEGRQDTRRDNGEFRVMAEVPDITNLSVDCTDVDGHGRDTFYPGETLKCTAIATNSGQSQTVVVSFKVDNDDDSATPPIYDSHLTDPVEDVTRHFAQGTTESFLFYWTVPLDATFGQYYYAVSFHDEYYVSDYYYSGWMPFVQINDPAIIEFPVPSVKATVFASDYFPVHWSNIISGTQTYSVQVYATTDGAHTIEERLSEGFLTQSRDRGLIHTFEVRDESGNPIASDSLALQLLVDAQNIAAYGRRLDAYGLLALQPGLLTTDGPRTDSYDHQYMVWVPVHTNSTNNWWRELFLYTGYHVGALGSLDNYAKRRDLYQDLLYSMILQPEIAERMKEDGTALTLLADRAIAALQHTKEASDTIELLRTIKHLEADSGLILSLTPDDYHQIVLAARYNEMPEFTPKLTTYLEQVDSLLSLVADPVTKYAQVRAEILRQQFLMLLVTDQAYARMQFLERWIQDHATELDPALVQAFPLAKKDVLRLTDDEFSAHAGALRTLYDDLGDLLDAASYLLNATNIFNALFLRHAEIGLYSHLGGQVLRPYILSFKIYKQLVEELDNIRTICLAATMYKHFEADFAAQMPTIRDAPSHAAVNDLNLMNEFGYYLTYYYFHWYEQTVRIGGFWDWVNPVNWPKIIGEALQGDFGSRNEILDWFASEQEWNYQDLLDTASPPNYFAASEAGWFAEVLPLRRNLEALQDNSRLRLAAGDSLPVTFLASNGGGPADPFYLSVSYADGLSSTPMTGDWGFYGPETLLWGKGDVLTPTHTSVEPLQEVSEPMASGPLEKVFTLVFQTSIPGEYTVKYRTAMVPEGLSHAESLIQRDPRAAEILDQQEYPVKLLSLDVDGPPAPFISANQQALMLLEGESAILRLTLDNSSGGDASVSYLDVSVGNGVEITGVSPGVYWARYDVGTPISHRDVYQFPAAELLYSMERPSFPAEEVAHFDLTVKGVQAGSYTLHYRTALNPAGVPADYLSDSFIRDPSSPGPGVSSDQQGWLAREVTIQVLNNDPPQINSVSPQSPASVLVNASTTFSVNTTDDHTSGLTYRWFLDGEALNDTDNSIVYSPGEEDLGQHSLIVYVDDGILVSYYTWEIQVQPPEPSGSFSGYVYNESGNPLYGATVKTTCGPDVGRSVGTADTGWYQITGLLPGAYCAEASKPGYSAVSLTNIVVSQERDIPGNNFTLIPASHSISGFVRDPNGAGIEGVSIAFDGYRPSVTTGPDGFYRQTGFPDSQTYVVTPSKAGLTFNPGSRTVAVDGTDVINIDFAAVETPAGWWNTNWHHRKPITISEQSGRALTDFQVLLSVDTSSLIAGGKMRSDCGDVRVTYFDGANEIGIPYYLESGCNTTSTAIWVKVPSIPASGDATVYMYYDNPNATSEAAPDSVFLLYDDFEQPDSTDPDPGKWVESCTYGGYPDCLAYGDAYIQDGQLKIRASQDRRHGIYSVQDFPIDNSYILEYRHLRDGGNYYVRASFRDSADVLNSDDWWVEGVSNITCAGNWYNVTDLGCWKNFEGNRFANYTLTSGWHHWTLIFDRQHDSISVYFDGNFAGSTDYSELTSMPHKVLIWNSINTSGAAASFDDVMLRKYAQPEPTHSIGLEESPPPTTPVADLAIAKSDEPDPVTAGSIVSYTLTIANTGPSDATGVSMTDTLPGGVTFVSATPSQGEPCSETSGTVTCNLGNITSGNTATVTIVVTVDLSTTGTLLNTAGVTATTTDPDTNNNTATELTAIEPEIPSDVRLYLDPNSTSAKVNQIFTVDIKADTGTATADTVDAYIDFDSAYLEVVDVSGAPTDGIEPPPGMFSSVHINRVDNAAGQIDFSASKYDSPHLTGAFTAATIRFKAKAEVDATSLTFVRSGARWSDLFRAGESLNPTITGGSVSITPGMVLDGRVVLERRGSQGDPRWITELYRVSGDTTAGGIQVYQAGTTNLLGTFSATTDADGRFSVALAGIEPGTYDIRVKGSNTLSNKKSNVSLPADTEVDFGTLLVGDSNGNDAVNGADVSYMIPSFLLCSGAPDFRRYGDTNKDECINGADVSALIPNFLKEGPIAATRLRVREPASQSQIRNSKFEIRNSASLSLAPSSASVQVSDIFTMDIAADAGTSILDTVDAYIDFDPTYLEVVDASGAPATTIELNTDVFSGATFNSVDNTTGQINFSASKYDSPYLTGSFTAATIRFRAKAAVDATSVTLVRNGARWSDLYLAGESLNPTITDSSVTVTCLDFVNPPPGVGVEEIQAVAGRWRQPAGLPYDLDGDKRVTIVDIMRVAAAWDSTCP